MKVVPYTFKRTPDDYLDGSPMYQVTLYLLFDGTTTFTFKHQFDLLENTAIVDELGIDYQIFHKNILVHKDRFSDIYKEIFDYVSESDND